VLQFDWLYEGELMDERVQILKDWMEQEERGTVWVAKKIGRTKAYISHILHERMPMTDKLARELRAKLGISMPEPRPSAGNRGKKSSRRAKTSSTDTIPNGNRTKNGFKTGNEPPKLAPHRRSKEQL
jgi:hypothetical protein